MILKVLRIKNMHLKVEVKFIKRKEKKKVKVRKISIVKKAEKVSQKIKKQIKK